MRRQVRFSIWFPVVLVAAFAAGCLFWLKIQIPADTSDWQTYRNEKYGFEVKYPINYQLKDSSNTSKNYFGIQILSPYPQGYQYFYLESIPLTGNFEQYVANQNRDETEYNCHTMIKSKNLKNLNGVEYECTSERPSYSVIFYFERNERVWQLHLDPFIERKIPIGNLEKNLDGGYRYQFLDSEVYNQILSTFKFIK